MNESFIPQEIRILRVISQQLFQRREGFGADVEVAADVLHAEVVDARHVAQEGQHVALVLVDGGLPDQIGVLQIRFK